MIHTNLELVFVGIDSVNDHGARRLNEPDGSPVAFTFDGRNYRGVEGEPIVLALLANGIRVLRHIPETGEVRGGFCFIGRCADCMVTVDGQPGVRACITPMKPGMVIEAGWANS